MDPCEYQKGSRRSWCALWVVCSARKIAQNVGKREMRDKTNKKRESETENGFNLHYTTESTLSFHVSLSLSLVHMHTRHYEKRERGKEFLLSKKGNVCMKRCRCVCVQVASMCAMCVPIICSFLLANRENCVVGRFWFSVGRSGLPLQREEQQLLHYLLLHKSTSTNITELTVRTRRIRSRRESESADSSFHGYGVFCTNFFPFPEIKAPLLIW